MPISPTQRKQNLALNVVGRFLNNLLVKQDLKKSNSHYSIWNFHILSSHLEPRKLTYAVILLTCIWEVRYSSLGQDIDSPD